MSEAQTRVGHGRGLPTGVPPISARTTLFCFGRLDGRKLAENWNGLSGKAGGAFLSVEELVCIARRHQLDAKLIQAGWHDLRGLLTTAPVLLVLRNGNAVLALANKPSPAVEIIAADPLYSDGDDFFLPREALEAAWDGIAFVVKRRSVEERSTTERPLSAARACTLAVTILPFLLYPIEASREDFVTSQIGRAVIDVGRAAPQPEPETMVGQAQPPADSVRSALFAPHTLTEQLTDQATEASEHNSVNSPPATRPLKRSLPWEPAAVAAINLPPRSEARAKSSVTVLRGASAAR